MTPNSENEPTLPERFGEPAITPAGTGSVYHWRSADEGQAIVMAREAHSLTANTQAQIDRGLALFASAGIDVGAVVAAVGVSGIARYAERIDLAMLEAQIEQGGCTSVFWRDGDRISRDHSTLMACIEGLLERGIAIYLGERVLEPADELQMKMLSLSRPFTAEKRARVTDRLRKTMERQRIDTA